MELSASYGAFLEENKAKEPIIVNNFIKYEGGSTSVMAQLSYLTPQFLNTFDNVSRSRAIMSNHPRWRQ